MRNVTQLLFLKSLFWHKNFKKMKRILFLLSLILLTMAACQSQNNTTASKISTSTSATVKSEVLTVADYKSKIADGKLQLVDVRTPEEYAGGTIGNAVNIDYLSGDFASKIQTLDKNQPVYIFCRSGNRSGQAAKVMQQLGFKEIYDLRGGYLAWSAQK